jgi:hypothetical protein
MRHDLGRHADRVIYILIAVLAVTVALEDTGSKPKQVLVYVVGTAVALTLAELFAARIGVSLRKHRRPTAEERRDELHAALTGLAVAALPTFFFLLALLDVMRLERAFVVAQWLGFAVIGVYTYLASRASGNGQLRSLLGGAGLLAIGGALIALNALVK